MGFNTEICCIGKDGKKRNFKYCLKESEENGKTKWEFTIIPKNKQPPRDRFEFTVTVVEEGIGKVTMMHYHNVSEYKAKGIPDKMIEEAHCVLNLTIISSSNKLGAKESRTCSAEKVWARLLKKGCAKYDKATDIYTYCRPFSIKN